jgi:hypothetical protein
MGREGVRLKALADRDILAAKAVNDGSTWIHTLSTRFERIDLCVIDADLPTAGHLFISKANAVASPQ